jgi:hypothetical protein
MLQSLGDIPGRTRGGPPEGDLSDKAAAQSDKIFAAKTDTEFCKLFPGPMLISPSRKTALTAPCNAVFTRCARRHPAKSSEAYRACLAQGSPGGQGWIIE